ncbi:MAG: ribosome-associated translation inhibitor RaiA [Candidatus Pacebacteria bacterium]|nr:ribosome-associated translation inhibitor RaiA [Candidatus Paceibacterota bacterium]
MELTPAIREYVERRVMNLEKFIMQHTDTSHADIEVGKTTKHHQKGDVFRAEINITLAGKAELFRAEAETTDLYAAIDMVYDDMSRKLKGFKGKRDMLYKRGAKTLKGLIKRFWM